ncbi:Bestrophin, RFP-TM, chloride channel-domain-containing protein [Polychytrium aggregatum]|uniref:Bestrophin, RFP-TM, chloride channel-domain-containing protein n=1 Tax=Polychytrium aggregatum TaxID=110093 RepID=UPI0022FDB888|nr:Bestrophin, RFP-TM, chloride channel-domain-containing protein [Polychytrium aggregatum]KAI9203282.1 Bestrophin, RFP-TM, chloride channel-domain-containing protein [Polychytrium aggregatum]
MTKSQAKGRPRTPTGPSFLDMYDPKENHDIWFKWTGSVIPKTLPLVAGFTVWGAIWACVFHLTPLQGVGTSMIPVVSIVVGLLLVFRTNAAYDRFYEGRRLWSQVITGTRSLAARVWSLCPEVTDDDRKRKRIAMRLMKAFPIALKNHLRGHHGLWNGMDLEVVRTDLKFLHPVVQVFEPAIELNSRPQDDLRKLLPPLPEFRHMYQEDMIAYVNAEQVKLNNIQSDTGSEHTVPLRNRQSISSFISYATTARNQYPRVRRPSVVSAASSTEHFHDYACGCINLPLEICHMLISFINESRRLEQVHFINGSSMLNHVLTLIDAMTGLERILTTPIPIAYTLHLRHTVFLFIAALPFQTDQYLGWGMIPFMTLVSFTLLGIEKIGSEIENPFGLEINDLPLEHYCDIILDEINSLMMRSSSKAKDWHYYTSQVETITPDLSDAYSYTTVQLENN